MAKHIKVKAELSEDFQKVKVTILEQSHFKSNFGNTGRRYWAKEITNYAFCHGNVRLTAWGGPGRLFINRYTSECHYDIPSAKHNVYLEDGAFYGCPSFDVPVSAWPDIKKAIEAYNEFYKDKTEACAVVVG